MPGAPGDLGCYGWLQMRTLPQAGDEPCCDPVAAPATLDPPDDVRLALLAKALGHPVRVRILRLLSGRRSCMTGEMVTHFDLAQSTVSEHLRVLKTAGLIQGEIEGPRRSYCLSAVGLAALRAGVASLAAGTDCASPASPIGAGSTGEAGWRPGA